MVASAVFILDLKGKVIISRNYRGDVPMCESPPLALPPPPRSRGAPRLPGTAQLAALCDDIRTPVVAHRAMPERRCLTRGATMLGCCMRAAPACVCC